MDYLLLRFVLAVVACHLQVDHLHLQAEHPSVVVLLQPVVPGQGPSTVGLQRLREEHCPSVVELQQLREELRPPAVVLQLLWQE